MTDTKRTKKAIVECARWLVKCIKLGWSKSDLDWLESLWWKYHDRTGKLIGGPHD